MDRLAELERRHQAIDGSNPPLCQFCWSCASEGFLDDSEAIYPCATAALFARNRELEAGLRELADDVDAL